jgi:hypothetical protein
LASLEISRAKSTSQENRQLPPKSESILRACVSVLVHSGCWNKITQIVWLIHNRNLFLSLVEAGKSK